MPWDGRIHGAIQAGLPLLLPTQAVNLDLLVNAILTGRTLCLSELARAHATPVRRRVAAPKHDRLHRVKRLWRFTVHGQPPPRRPGGADGAHPAHGRAAGASAVAGPGRRLDAVRRPPPLRPAPPLPSPARRGAPPGARSAPEVAGLRLPPPARRAEPAPARGGGPAGGCPRPARRRAPRRPRRPRARPGDVLRVAPAGRSGRRRADRQGYGPSPPASPTRPGRWPGTGSGAGSR